MMGLSKRALPRAQKLTIENERSISPPLSSTMPQDVFVDLHQTKRTTKSTTGSGQSRCAQEDKLVVHLYHNKTMQFRGNVQLLLALAVATDLVTCRPSFLTKSSSVARPRAARITSSSSAASSILQVRGGSDEGVTLHGTTSSMAEKLYLPGLLDTTIHRTNKVCPSLDHLASHG